MIFEILKDATDYTIENKRSIIVLGLLYFCSMLIIPLIIIEGYSYNMISKCLSGTINLKERIPPLTLDLDLFINGFKLFIVKIIYLLPLILFILYGFFNLSNEFIVNLTITVVLLLLGFFIYLIASVHMIQNKSFIKAFDFKGIYQIIKQIGLTIYLKLYLIISIFFIGTTFVSLIIISFISLIIIYLLEIIKISILFDIFGLIFVLIFIIFTLTIIPIYTIFKNRAISSIYNLR